MKVVETHWDDLAAGYDAAMCADPTMTELREAVVSTVPNEVSKVIDLGCGTGALMWMLREANPEVNLTGVDPSGKMLERAKNAVGDAKFVRASAAGTGLPDASADAIVSNFALHHLEHSEKRFAANEMFRLLRPGGIVVIGDQFFSRLGTPDDKQWVGDLFRHLCGKAEYYLLNAGTDRMFLQVELMPQFLRCDGELPVPPEFWLEALSDAGFSDSSYRDVGSPELMHGVVSARKEA